MNCTSNSIHTTSQVLRLAKPEESQYAIRWPFYARSFNTRAYSSNQLIASDVEAMLRVTLKNSFGIEEKAFKVWRWTVFPISSEWLNKISQEYSIVLVIPDFYDRFYVELLCNVLLVQMGFRQLCAQQVTYPLGLLPTSTDIHDQ